MSILNYNEETKNNVVSVIKDPFIEEIENEFAGVFNSVIVS